MCWKEDVSSARACEEVCTSHSPCIGYYSSTGSSYKSQYCHIIPSSRSCPATFQFHKYNQATKASDMVAVSLVGYVCYTKDSGKKFVIF